MKKNNLELYTAVYGDTVAVPMYEFGKGAKNMYIQGGVHGGEATYFILHKVAKYLESVETELDSGVTIVPICNPVAWNQRVYYYTVGKFDLYKGKDWNRSYPGDETTLSARMSKKIFDIARKHDVVIDLHTARVSKPYPIYMSQDSKPVIEVLDFKYNYYIDATLGKNSVFLGTLNDALVKFGTKEVTIECGSHDDFDQESVDVVFEAIKRLIDTMCLKKKRQKSKENVQYQFDKVVTLFSPMSCFANYIVQPHTQVRKGQKLATLYPSSNLVEATDYLAPFDGLIFELPKTHILWEGDELFKIVPAESIKKVHVMVKK